MPVWDFLGLNATGDRAAVGYMLVSVAVSSMAPLMIAVIGVAHIPFVFTAGMQAGGMAGYLLFLLVRYPRLVVDPGVRGVVRDHIFHLGRRTVWFFLGVVSGLDYALFVWSTRFIDISATTILFESWPFFLIFFVVLLYRGTGRYRKFTFTLGMLLVTGFAGSAFVIASQYGGFGEFGNRTGYEIGFGVMLAVLASLATSLAAYLFRWGSSLADGLVSVGGIVPNGGNSVSLEMFCVAIGIVISDVLSIAMNASIGLASGESLAFPPLIAGFFVGIFVYALGSMTWRMSNLTTGNLGVNALGYAAPVVALVLLWAFSQAEVANPGFLVIGSVAIVASNLLINFEAEIRWGFKALIFALLSFGAFVYLRDEVFSFFGVEEWLWKGGGYFESIALSATVFTLLLAFRVTRLVSRTSEEDNRTFIVYRNLDLLARRGIIDGDVCGHILEIDRSRDLAVVRVAYQRARDCMAEVVPGTLGEADIQLLSQAESNLDALVRSKQVDIHLGEMFALVIFGMVTVGLALFSRPPQVEGWTRLLADVFAMVVSAVIVFMLVHIQDLQRERDDPKLELQGATVQAYSRYMVLFPDTARRSFDQWLSVVVGVTIVATYVGLLGHRWLG